MIGSLRCGLFVLAVVMPLSVAADFSIKAGVSYEIPEDEPGSEVGLPGPLGLIRLEYDTSRKNTLFCEHMSSIPKTSDGAGINHCGMLMKF